MPKCKNCQSELLGDFCHNCGQSSKIERISFKQLSTHLLEDITSLDSRALGTFRNIIKRPNKIASDYIAGKRRSYLNPISLYLISIALFLVFMSFFLGMLKALFVVLQQKLKKLVITS